MNEDNILEEDITRIFAILKERLIKSKSRFIIKDINTPQEKKYPQKVQLYLMQEDVDRLKVIVRVYSQNRGFIVG